MHNVDIFREGRVSRGMATVSADVIRAGRALIRMSQDELARRSGLSIPTLRRIETDQKGVSVEAVGIVQKILEGEGVEFLPETDSATEGVRRRKKA